MADSIIERAAQAIPDHLLGCAGDCDESTRETQARRIVEALRDAGWLARPLDAECVCGHPPLAHHGVSMGASRDSGCQARSGAVVHQPEHCACPFTAGEAAFHVLGRVERALADHPRVCDAHPEDDPITCGWKRAVADVQAALDEGGADRG